ncbi:MAG: flagellar basal body-associated FliL family protein [Roseovarius sp.]
MKKLLLPLILGLVGVAGGVGAGIALRPTGQPEGLTNPCGEADHAEKAHTDENASEEGHVPGAEQDYVKLNNQFVVPVVSDDAVQSLVVLSLSIEIDQGQRELVYAREPKLRDAFLQVLFDHANMGGFEGTFTDGNTLDILRAALTETARNVLGTNVTGVLIVDIARQDI